jgi:enoyl-CoA hydratase/carnithine racemase
VTNNRTDPPVLVENRGSVRWITLNRPEVHNAQNVSMLISLDAAFDACRTDTSIRVVVLAGAGRSFCSGHDLTEMSRNAEYASNAATAEGRYWQERRLFVDPVLKFRSLPIPTICRIQGHCLAAGLMFAAAADFSIAASDAIFGSPVLAELAVNDAEVPIFSQRVGERRAKQALWLNERWSADEALDAGLLNWVVPLDELDTRCIAVSERLAEMPPQALALSKDVFRFMADQSGESAVSQYHFISHQLSHQTAEASTVLNERLKRLSEGKSSFRKSSPSSDTQNA